MRRMKQQPPRRTCPTCKGGGTVEITGQYADTLVLLRSQKQELNGAQLARIAGIKETAMNNRLVGLERFGLASGRWYGRQRLWSATNDHQ